MAVVLGSGIWRVVAIALALAGPLHPGRVAAQQTVPLGADRLQPMQVVLARDPRPECGSSCTEWIAAQGTIDASTPRRFASVLKRIGARRIPIFVDSRGGMVEAALAVGQMVRSRHLDVVVTRTAFDPCAPKDLACQPARADGNRPGHPHGAGSICASACIFILAAGEKREAASWTGVGVHQIIQKGVVTRVRRLFRITWQVVNGRRVETSRTLVSVTPISKTDVTLVPKRSGYAKIAAYLARMGIGSNLVSLMLATPHQSIHWMTPDEEAATGIVTDHVDGAFMVAGAYAPAHPVSVASAAGGGSATSGASVPPPPDRAELMISGETTPHLGSVAWSFDQPGQPPAYVDKPSLRADFSFADLSLKLALRVDGQPATAGPASFHLVLNVLHPASGKIGAVTDAKLTYPGPSGGDVTLGPLTRTAADAFEATLSRDDLMHLLPPAGSGSPSFTLDLVPVGSNAARLSFDRTPGANPAMAAARTRLLAPAPPGS